MKQRYFSDLHLEFINPNKIQQFIQKFHLVLTRYVYWKVTSETHTMK